MNVRALVRDCLHLNWALPVAALPPPPGPLRFQVHPSPGGEVTFASALCFHIDEVHLLGLGKMHPGFPQFHLRLAVIDGDGTPAVLFRRILVPPWAVPATRLVARQPAWGAWLTFPRPSRHPGAESWTWRVGGRHGFVATARLGATAGAEASLLGSLPNTVRYFLARERGYVEIVGGLRRLEVTQPVPGVEPVQVELVQDDLVRDGLGLTVALPRLHSAWICSELAVTFDVLPGLIPEVAVAQPATAVG